MSQAETVVVVGLGEIGKPILELVARNHRAVGVDVTPPAERVEGASVMHVCYPFLIKDFVGETARYIEMFRPRLTVINSTVAVGTTRAIARRTGAVVVHSPVRGKHARMREELLHYTKFVGALDAAAGDAAARHFQSLGMKTRVLSSPEAAELAKLCETTYFGVMIAWAQEVERYCDQLGVSYDEAVSLYEGIKFFPPVKYFPGVIGGHCVMANIDILTKMKSSEVLEAVQASNQKKLERDAASSQAGPANPPENTARTAQPAAQGNPARRPGS